MPNKRLCSFVIAITVLAMSVSSCSKRRPQMQPEIPALPAEAAPEPVPDLPIERRMMSLPRLEPERQGTPAMYPRSTVETPGLANPDVTQANIRQTICKSGWTKTIRPPSNYTTRLKREQMGKLRLRGSTQDYEEDHFISLELGGDPKDPRNLWPQPYNPKPGARQKDRVENYLHDEVCQGHLTLRDAQMFIVQDWYSVFLAIGSPDHSGDDDDNPGKF
jgi:hypothetical protein